MKNQKVLHLCELALLVALEILMGLTPLGYLNLGIIAASLLTIPVAIGAILLGPRESTLLGLVFGIISFIKGFSSTGLMTRAMYAASLPGSFVVTIVARVLMGLCVGLLVWSIRRVRRKKSMADILAGSFGAPLLNTAFYMGFLMLLFYNSEYIQNLIRVTQIRNPFLLIGLMVGVQAIIEAVTCGVISSAVCKALQVTVMKRKERRAGSSGTGEAKTPADAQQAAGAQQIAEPKETAGLYQTSPAQQTPGEQQNADDYGTMHTDEF